MRNEQLSLIGTYNINVYLIKQLNTFLVKKNVNMPNFLRDVVNVFQRMTAIDKLFKNSENLNDNDLISRTSLIFEKRYKNEMLEWTIISYQAMSKYSHCRKPQPNHNILGDIIGIFSVYIENSNFRTLQEDGEASFDNIKLVVFTFGCLL